MRPWRYLASLEDTPRMYFIHLNAPIHNRSGCELTLIGSRSSGLVPAVTGLKAFLVAANMAAPLSASGAVVVGPPVFRSVKGRNFFVMSSDIPFEPDAFAFVPNAVEGPLEADTTRVERVVRVGAFSIGAEDVLAASLLRVDALVGIAPDELVVDLGGIGQRTV